MISNYFSFLRLAVANNPLSIANPNPANPRPPVLSNPVCANAPWIPPLAFSSPAFALSSELPVLPPLSPPDVESGVYSGLGSWLRDSPLADCWTVSFPRIVATDPSGNVIVAVPSPATSTVVPAGKLLAASIAF